MIDALLRQIITFIMPLQAIRKPQETISEVGLGQGSLNVNNGSKALKGN